MANKASNPNFKVIAKNRRARFEYDILDELECGIMLEGSEVKALRIAQANISESYASVEQSELWLINGYIAPYDKASIFRHDERRRRKLLVTKRELGRLWSSTKREGTTLVPLVLYFNHKGLAKLKIGIARGRKKFDKREHERKRDWDRTRARLLKQG